MVKMKAIEYNTFITLLALLDSRLKGGVALEYGITKPISVIPSYPRDLSECEKPSIIIRKVNTNQSPIGMGNVLGQYLDDETNAYTDVSGIVHDITVQIDMLTDNITSNLILISAITDGILQKILIEEGSQFILYNYVDNYKNPTPIGICKLMHEISITNADESDLNNDYISVIRFDINIIQAIVPQQEFVDLSKWMKIRYKIN